MARSSKPRKPDPDAATNEADVDGRTPSAAAAAPAAIPRAKTVRRRPVDLIDGARSQLKALTGYPVDSVSEFGKTDDGWKLTVAVVELRRIPPSTDVLAEYVVGLDPDGDIVDYHRGRRYYRDQVGEPE